MTKERLEILLYNSLIVLADEQDVTIEELKSSNEDRDISDIMIDFYAAYNAYQASLTAASKVGSQSLLDYLR